MIRLPMTQERLGTGNRALRPGSMSAREPRPASSRGGESLRLDGLDKYGVSRIEVDRKEKLRRALISDLESKGLAEVSFPSVAVHEEVEKFLQNGHISDSNLSRLERRVVRRTRQPAIPASAREQRTVISEFSVASKSAGSRTPCGLEASAYAPGSSRGCTTAVEQDFPKWSEVANHAKLLEAKDKAEARGTTKFKQERMRLELEEQMKEKEKKKSESAEEEKKTFDMQKVELMAWHESENAVVEKQRKMAFEVKKEREVQIAVVHAIREDERRQKLADADLHIKNAAVEVEKEKTAALYKKHAQRDTMHKLMSEWEKDRDTRDAEARRKAADEQVKVGQYQQLLDDQEVMNKKNVPTARMPNGEYSPPNKAERRKKERQLDDQMMAQVKAANAKAAEAELTKSLQTKRNRHSNQEFLAKQMEERESSRKVNKDLLEEQKSHVLAATQEFMEFEKQRIEQQRMKNIQHRLELEKQIQNKQPPTRFQKRHNEDVMTAAEVAMNRRLLEEARSMREPSSKQARPASEASEMRSTF